MDAKIKTVNLKDYFFLKTDDIINVSGWDLVCISFEKQAITKG